MAARLDLYRPLTRPPLTVPVSADGSAPFPAISPASPKWLQAKVARQRAPRRPQHARRLQKAAIESDSPKQTRPRFQNSCRNYLESICTTGPIRDRISVAVPAILPFDFNHI